MNARNSSKLGLLVLGFVLVLGASANAQGPARGANDQFGQKTVAFEMRGKPWDEVIKWLAKETGLPFYGTDFPKGSFTYVGPLGLAEKKTIPQVIDILNDGMRSQKYRIIHRNQALYILAADEVAGTDMVDRVTPDELGKYGNTELVQLTVPLKVMNADEFAPQVKQLMTPFGEVRGLAASNSLYLKDEVGAIKQVLNMIKESESTENRQGDTISIPCKFISALYAERILKEMLGDPAKNPMGGNDGAAMMAQLGAMMAAGGQPGGGGGPSRNAAIRFQSVQHGVAAWRPRGDGAGGGGPGSRRSWRTRRG